MPEEDLVSKVKADPYYKAYLVVRGLRKDLLDVTGASRAVDVWRVVDRCLGEAESARNHPGWPHAVARLGSSLEEARKQSFEEEYCNLALAIKLDLLTRNHLLKALRWKIIDPRIGEHALTAGKVEVREEKDKGLGDRPVVSSVTAEGFSTEDGRLLRRPVIVVRWVKSADFSAPAPATLAGRARLITPAPATLALPARVKSPAPATIPLPARVIAPATTTLALPVRVKSPASAAPDPQTGGITPAPAAVAIQASVITPAPAQSAPQDRVPEAPRTGKADSLLSPLLPVLARTIESLSPGDRERFRTAFQPYLSAAERPLEAGAAAWAELERAHNVYRFLPLLDAAAEPAELSRPLGIERIPMPDGLLRSVDLADYDVVSTSGAGDRFRVVREAAPGYRIAGSGKVIRKPRVELRAE
jgi:hypothetical protein